MFSKSSSTCCRIPNSAPTNSTSRRSRRGRRISRRNDEVGEIAARESAKLAYGADNPYAREPEYSTIAAITRQDLLDWHQHVCSSRTTSFSGSAATSIPRRWKPSCAPHSTAWQKGADVAERRHSIPPRQARLLPHSKRRCEPEHHSHGHAGHHAQQSRLLRHHCFQRSVRRRILLAPVQRHPHQARPRLQRGRRHRREFRASRHSAIRDGHEEPEHDRVDSSAR